jgi:hypothetical protein
VCACVHSIFGQSNEFRVPTRTWCLHLVWTNSYENVTCVFRTGEQVAHPALMGVGNKTHESLPLCMCTCIWIINSACIFVWQGQGERQEQRSGQGQGQVCVCVCMCVCIFVGVRACSHVSLNLLKHPDLHALCVCVCVCMCMCLCLRGSGSLLTTEFEYAAQAP